MPSKTGERCEREFVKRIKKIHPDCFLRKWPDFKSTGVQMFAGMPDYVITTKEHGTYYVECKSTKNKSLSVSAFQPSQRYEFPRIIKAGGIVKVFVHIQREYYLIHYDHFMKLKGKKSLSYNEIRELGVRI